MTGHLSFITICNKKYHITDELSWIWGRLKDSLNGLNYTQLVADELSCTWDRLNDRSAVCNMKYLVTDELSLMWERLKDRSPVLYYLQQEISGHR